LAACAAFSASKPAAVGPSGAEALAEARELHLRGSGLATFAARGGASASEGSTRRYFRFELLGKRPDRLLVTVLSPAGTPVYRLSHAGGLVSAVDYSARTHRVGLPQDAAADRMLEFFRPESLLPLLTASAPGPPLSASATTAVSGGIRRTELVEAVGGSPEGFFWRLFLEEGQGGEPSSPVLKKAEYGPLSSPVLTVSYDAHAPTPREDLGGRAEPFPRKTTIAWTAGRGRLLEVRCDEVRLGVELPDALFVLEKPPGFSSAE
jgi:hypothetical protein